MNKEFPTIKTKLVKGMLKPEALYLISFGNEQYNIKSPRYTHWGSSNVWHSTKEIHVERTPVYAYGKHIKISGNFISVEKGFCSLNLYKDFMFDPEDSMAARRQSLRRELDLTFINRETSRFETQYRTDIQNQFMVGNVSVDVITVDKKSILSSDWYNKTIDAACVERDTHIAKAQAEYKEYQEEIAARLDAEAKEKATLEKEIADRKLSALIESEQQVIVDAITESKKVIHEPKRKDPFWKRVWFYLKHPNRKYPK